LTLNYLIFEFFLLFAYLLNFISDFRELAFASLFGSLRLVVLVKVRV